MAESIDIRELNIRIEQQSGFVTNLVTGMDRVIVGQKHLVDSLLISLLSDGHILLEGVPGLAKTLDIKTRPSSCRRGRYYDLFSERGEVSGKEGSCVC